MNHNLELFLSFIPALVVILLFSRICGSLVLYIGQPRVVGEMVAGILLGPTLLGTLFLNFSKQLFTPDVKSLLFVFSNLGLTLYMFLVGAGIEHSRVSRKNLGQSVILALSGILPPFVLGACIGYFMYEEISLPNVPKTSFVIFMGCALCITAFPMLARILQERDLTNTKVGALTLMAASIDDAVAWSLLALVTALAQAKSMMAGLYTAGSGFVFALVMILIVRRLLVKLGQKVEEQGYLSSSQFALVMTLVLLAAFITDYIGIFSVFGGFITGLVMPKNPVFMREINHKLMDFVSVVLLPIFFVYSGLNTKLIGLSNVTVLIPFVVITLASILGKYGGCMLAMRGLGFTWREASAVGALMNARGLMELAMVNIGLAYGIISSDLFTILVYMAVITTAMAMPAYNLSLPKNHELRRTLDIEKILKRQSA